MSEAKRKKAFYWKFREGEDQRIFEWMEKQHKVSESLRVLVLDFVDKYGIREVNDFDIIKEMIKNETKTDEHTPTTDKDGSDQKKNENIQLQGQEQNDSDEGQNDDDLYNDINLNNW